ncbi:MAG: Yip1 family protein [Ignavibacteria bacterium]
MSEENSQEPENTDLVNQSEQLTNTEAMAGVITAPGETFEIIANTPKKNYWLLPVIIFIVLNLISTVLFISDTELTNKSMDKQREAMREQFDKNIKEGKMTKEDSEKAMESMNPAGIFFKGVAFGGSVIGPFLMLIILSVVYVLGLKVMKSDVDFTNVLNVVGLALLIFALGNLISTVISVLRGEMSTLGPALLFNEVSAGKKAYALLSKIDVFTIWFYAVVSIGLSKLGRIEMYKAAILAFGVWIIYSLLTALIF